jgi:histidyl-tRNA synthetase
MKISAIKGMHDILPPQTSIWREVENTARKIFALYNFHEIRTPILEKTELFVRSIGDSTDIVEKEMYSFEDSQGNSMTLRPEGTASIVRAYIKHALYKQGAIHKLYYMGPMFRHERPQSGRYRQFHQIGAEVFGSSSPYTDAETLFLLSDFFRKIDLTNLTFKLNTVGCHKCRPLFKEKLVAYLGAFRNKLCENCKRRLVKNPLRIFDCKNETCKSILAAAPSIIDHICEECRGHFTRVVDLMKKEGLRILEDKNLVRGLDYYTKTAFEVVVDYSGSGAQDAIVGGGRYDSLVEELGGPPTPAFGFAIGMDRLIPLTEHSKEKYVQQKPPLFIAYTGEDSIPEAFSMVTSLRQNGIPADMSPKNQSLKAQMKYAHRLKANYVVIFGEEETRNGLVAIRNMNNSTQSNISLSVESIIEAISSGSSFG